MTNINKYQDGKIYTVRNDITDDIYIGSTTMALSKRMVKHRCDAKTRPELSFFYTFMNEMGIEHFYIELVENFPCNSVEELRKREGEITREIGTLNKRIEQPDMDMKEYFRQYYQDHIERYREYKKKWKANNREKVNEDARKQYWKDPKGAYERHKPWKSIKHECECGGHYINGNKASHFKSKKHQAYLNQQNEI